METMTPALQKTNEKPLKELSAEEFQQKLSSWYQNKGLVQDMKTYLKYQMINALRNTVVGTEIKRTASQTGSLAQQASHLIVAEYLLYHQCHYTLSLFSTEVNLSNALLPEARSVFDPESKFNKENLINILELIGLDKQHKCFNKVCSDYFDGNNNNNPLLSCLLNVIGKSTSNEKDEEEQHPAVPLEVDFEDDDFMRNIYVVLQASNVSAKLRTQLLHNLKACYDLKTKYYESHVAQLIGRFKKELHYLEQKLEHNQRRRRCLEKKLLKLKEDNQMSRQEERVVVEKIVPATPCCLSHCTEGCVEVRRLSDGYKEEINKLKSQNLRQKGEIQRLNARYGELMQEFNCCQSKIDLVNTRLQQEIVYNHKDNSKVKDSESISLSSESITEEIIQQARQKLRLLEEESEELDIRFSKFVIIK